MTAIRSTAKLIFACLITAAVSTCRPDTVVPTKAAEDDPIAHRAGALFDSLTLEGKIGQLMIIDLFNDDGSPVLILSNEDKLRLTNLAPGGVVLYGANIDTVEQVRSLSDSLQSIGDIPLFISIDHEGGTVNRLDDSGKIAATVLPTAKSVGAGEDPDYAYRIAGIMGRELAALGFNMNFAPVADILSSGDSVIGSRSYGSDPALVSSMVAMTVRGLQEQGVSSVLKHFPGHGGVVGDSHSGRVYLPTPLPALAETAFLPFRTGADEGADGIMAAHIVVGSPDTGSLPVTVSDRGLSDLLRAGLGYNGLIITDSLTMKAVEDVDDRAVKAIKAGADMLLRPGPPKEIRDQLVAAVREGRLSEAAIDEAVRRVIGTKLKRRLSSAGVATPASVIGSEAHRLIVEGAVEK